jgi:hypothetical protein
MSLLALILSLVSLSTSYGSTASKGLKESNQEGVELAGFLGYPSTRCTGAPPGTAKERVFNNLDGKGED